VTLRKSTNAPLVKLLSPGGGEHWGGLRTIQWSATDHDGDPMTFAILYSPDGGGYWTPVAWGIQGQSNQVNTDTWPGGTNARVRVIVTDGFRTAQDENDSPFVVSNKPPETVVVVQPTNNAAVPANQPTVLEALANDLEEGLLSDDAFVWSYGTNVFATGRRVTATLPTGIKSVTLTVYDSEGRSNRVSVAVHMVDATPPVIALLGADSVNVEQGTPYVEPGYTASDEVDGDLTSEVVVRGSVDCWMPGTYAVRYNVSDAAGNSALERTRQVEVQPIVLRPVDFDVFGRPVIRWRSATGSFYEVFSASNLLLHKWRNEGDQPSAGSQTEWIDTNVPLNQKYYRVRRVWP
jgi:hypothetical protein